MYLCHLGALLGACWVGISWRLVGLAAATYAVRMLALSGGYHRYFAHRSYQTGRFFQLVIAFVGGTCTQRGALWWAANHRHHHPHSDREGDIRSPRQRGFFWSHRGWILSKRFEATRSSRIRDFARFPELRWLDRHHFVPSLVFAGALLWSGGWPAVVWGVSFLPAIRATCSRGH